MRPTASRRSGSSIATIARSSHESRIGRARARASSRSLIDHLARRAAELDLRVGGLDAATLIELTAFGTAVVMNHRYTSMLGRTSKRIARSVGRADMKIVVLHTRRCARAAAVDPLLDQLTTTLARARARRRDACRGQADSRAGRRASCARATPTSCSTSPSRSAERARSSRTSRRCSIFSDLRYTGSSPGGLLLAGDKSLTKKVLELSRYSDAGIRDVVSRCARLGGRSDLSR